MTHKPGKAPVLLADNTDAHDALMADVVPDEPHALMDEASIPVVDYVRTEYPPAGERKSARFPKLADPFDDDTNHGDRMLGFLMLALAIFTGFMVVAFVVVRVAMWIGVWP